MNNTKPAAISAESAAVTAGSGMLAPTGISSKQGGKQLPFSFMFGNINCLSGFLQ
jgi:hypothetical protein